jgi:WD40 repeat protein
MSSWKLEGHTDSVYAVAIHPTMPDILATASGDDTGGVWSRQVPSPPIIRGMPPIPTPALSSFPPHTPPSRACRSAGRRLFTLAGHTDTVVDVAFSHNGAYLATAGMDGLVKVHR